MGLWMDPSDLRLRSVRPALGERAAIGDGRKILRVKISAFFVRQPAVTAAYFSTVSFAIAFAVGCCFGSLLSRR